MKENLYGKYVVPFLIAVLLLAVYKLFDSVGYVWQWVTSIFAVLYPVIIAFAIAWVLYPICKRAEGFFSGTKLPLISARSRALSVAVVYAGVACLIAAFFYILVPTILKSVASFTSAVPHIMLSVISKINRLPFVSIEPANVYDLIENYLASSPLARPEVYTSTVVGVSTWLVNAVLSVIMSVYILLDRESLIRWARFAAGIFIPEKKRRFISKYAFRCGFFIYKYFCCTLVDAVIIFGLSFLLLSVLKVKYAPTLAFVLGVFNLVPYFGSIIASAMAVVVTLITSGVSKGVTVGICLLVLQQLDGNIIHPHIIKESLSVKPFWVLAGLFVGGGLFGIWGIVLSVPALALIKSVLCDLMGSKTSNN